MTGKAVTYTIILLSICAGIYYASQSLYSFTANGPTGQLTDEGALRPFLDSKPMNRPDFEALGLYFEKGLEANRDPTGSSAHYRGLSSNHGYRVDQIDGFTRTAPLLALLLNTNSSISVAQAQQSRQLLIDGLTQGTDRNAAGYWGTISDNNQLIVEASDVALTVWLLRHSLWLDLSSGERSNVIRWLLQVNNKSIPDNNWHLFVTYINVVVNSLGYSADMAGALKHYKRFCGFYKGDGWFSDGPGDRFDYYNAWGIHYQLFWIDQADGGYDHAFITTALDRFAQHLAYLIGPEGVPILGRSICYRMAVTAPLLLDQQLAWPSIKPGVARRALRLTWSYYIRHGGVRNGNISQGYCASDSRVLDNYSGPASCLWGLRSLISALYLPSYSNVWTEPEDLLPVERADFLVNFTQPGWIVRGSKPGLIVIEKASGLASYPLSTESPLIALVDLFTNKAHRPENERAKYGLSQYRSDLPFCGCASNP